MKIIYLAAFVQRNIHLQVCFMSSPVDSLYAELLLAAHFVPDATIIGSEISGENPEADGEASKFRKEHGNLKH
jgi:hypothetical protein